MPLINCEINLILTWPTNFLISQINRVTTFAIADKKIYVLFVTLSTIDNAKLLPQLKSGSKRIINWNKYQPKVAIQQQNPYLDYLIQDFRE